MANENSLENKKTHFLKRGYNPPPKVPVKLTKVPPPPPQKDKQK